MAVCNQLTFCRSREPLEEGQVGSGTWQRPPLFCATLALMEAVPFDDTFETGYLSKYRRKQQGRFISANVDRGSRDGPRVCSV